MPRVRAYGGRQVERRPIAGVRQQTVSPVGEGLARLGEQVAGIATSAFQVMQARDDQDAIQKFDNDLSEKRQELLQRVYAAHGQDAFEVLPPAVEQEFTDFAGGLEKTIKNDRQRAAFSRVRGNQQQSLQERVFTHALQERERFHALQTQKGAELALNDAIAGAGKPEVVARFLARGEAITRDGLRGQAPETIEAGVQAFRTSVHEGVIERLLAHDQDRAAQVYFEETRDQIAGASLPRIERALEEGSLRGESQREADAIIAAGGTLSDWRDKAKAIEDPKTRDAVMQRVEEEGRMQAAQQRQVAENTLRSAYDILDKTGSLRKIPPALWTSLDGSDRSALRSYAKSMVEGGGSASIKTDMGTLYDLLTLSSTDETAFLKTNLLKYRTQLSPGDLEQLMRQQATLRAGKKGGDSDLFVSQKAQNDMVDEALALFGLDVTPENLRKTPGALDRVNAFRRAVREAVTRQERQTGKKATDPDVQGIVDTLAARTGQRMTKDGLLFDTYAPAFAFETAQAKVLKVADVPAAERRKIEAALSRHGVAITPDKIVELFNQQLARVRGDR